MLETALTAFTTFFAVIGPIDTAVLLASLTPNMTPGERRAIAVKAVFIATIIILIFALVGQPVLTQLGVSLSALQTAGGIILFMIALEMTLAKRPGPVASLSAKESEEAAEAHAEIAVFPFATPLIAGPGAMTSAIVLAAGTKGDLELLGAVVAAILAVMLVTLILLLAAQEIHQLIGLTARKVIVRVFGVLLAALAVQSIFNGIAGAHIFG
jgi:multiple antibiotic resistance protein